MKEIDAYKPITIEEVTKIVDRSYWLKDNKFVNNLFLIDYDDCKLFCEYYLKKHSHEVMDYFYSEFKKVLNNKEIKSE